MSTVVLMCVVFSALAGGVLLAYGMCVGMFHVFRIHSIQAAQQRALRAEMSRQIPGANAVAG